MSQTRKQRREAAAKAARQTTPPASPAVSVHPLSVTDEVRLAHAFNVIEELEDENAKLRADHASAARVRDLFSKDLRQARLALRDKQFGYFVAGLTAGVIILEGAQRLSALLG